MANTITFDVKVTVTGHDGTVQYSKTFSSSKEVTDWFTTGGRLVDTTDVSVDMSRVNIGKVLLLASRADGTFDNPLLTVDLGTGDEMATAQQIETNGIFLVMGEFDGDAVNADLVLTKNAVPDTVDFDMVVGGT